MTVTESLATETSGAPGERQMGNEGRSLVSRGLCVEGQPVMLLTVAGIGVNKADEGCALVLVDL